MFDEFTVKPFECLGYFPMRGAAVAEPDRLRSRESVAAAGVADEDRHLVTDQLAAAAGQDRRPILRSE